MPTSPVSRSPNCYPPSRERLRAFFVHSFNSQRLLAFCERTFFSTPYTHGQVSVSCLLPASVELAFGGATAFRAAMGVGAEDAERVPSNEGETVL